MQSAESLGAALDLPAPPATEAEAESLARAHFGVEARARALSGERDRNFHLRDAAGRDYVLKVGHPAEDPAVLDLQGRALLHVAARDPSLPVPRVLLADGAPQAAWQAPGLPPRMVRLLTYLPGRPLAEVPADAAQRRAIGACLARLDLALGDFRHPAEGHDLLWDLQRMARVRPLLAEVPADRRDLPLRFLDRFEAHVLPALPGLRAQLVHNDFNPHNVLAAGDDDRRVAGIIDFGDMVRAPLVQDVATAAAYQLSAAGLDGVAELAAAFHAVLPLRAEEVAVLADLTAARLVLTIAISSWRAARHPGNAAYILRNQGRAWEGLRRLDAIPREAAVAALRAACPTG
ncbi:phosphotransferase [Roseomonas sp. NAR14]|uniref:Hydroxylysine kinase n=1 Tax=Roseomonas acroporae TaxID=2937791 RepID=A0A9X2BTY6_9PROT|nr:phosphotransferase [Roseomonas acroporae]MCK8784827.1 phosphotransferase [Roseomonas acroporae]